MRWASMASRNAISWSTSHALISVRLRAWSDGASARATTLRTTVPLRAASLSALFNITWMLCTVFGARPLAGHFSPGRFLRPLLSSVA